MRMFYFGTNGSPGHYLYNSNMTRTRSFDFKEIPWGVKIDTGLLDKTKSQVNGQGVLAHKDGWTALSFWNRIDDKRSGCNSAFIVDREATFDEMVHLARTFFPQIMERLHVAGIIISVS